MRTGAACALVGLLSFGCPKSDEPPSGFDPNDPLIKKLQAEQERLAKAGPPKPKAAAAPDPLAEIAAAPAKPEGLGIPSGVTADLGPVTLSLIEVLQSQRVGNDRVSLATTDRFLKVTLEAVSKESIDLDLSTARLEREGQSVNLARDAQRAAQGSPLSTHLDKGASKDLVLYFEAPDEMIKKGLKIILTRGESRVELALQ